MKKIKVLTIAFFLFVIAFFPIATFLAEKKGFSASEGRDLSRAPEFTVAGYIDKSFNKNFEVYFQDHFYKRLGLSRVYFSLERSLGRNQINNTMIGAEEQLFYTPVRSLASAENFHDKFSLQINQLVEETKPANIPVHLFVLPSKPHTLNDLYNPTSQDQFYREELNTMTQWVNPYVTVHDVGKEWREKYTTNDITKFFYKTDHHWNGLGAYEGYTNIVGTLQEYDHSIQEPLSTDHLNNICAKDTAYFEGSHNRVILYQVASSDEYICNWEIDNFNRFEEITYHTQAGDIAQGADIFSNNIEGEIINYARLTTGDFPYMYFKNNMPSNEINALIIRDSYTNAITSTLAAHFNEAHLLDMRHYTGNLAELINENDINLILLLHNSVSINSNVATYYK
ncbi:MAG: hypothetical protein ABS949_14380 [Solibacillus sp.]